MKMIMRKISFFTSILFFISCNSDTNDYKVSLKSEISGDNVVIDTNSIIQLEPILHYDSLETQNNFKLTKIEITSEGLLILADNSNQNIYFINPTNERRIATFGNNGFGPSEFKYINVLRYIPNVGVLVVDNRLQRCTIFDFKGNVKSTFQTNQIYDDIEIINDSLLIFSNYEANKDHKSVKIYSRNKEQIISSFGPILEPKENYFEMVDKATTEKYSLSTTFSHQSLTGILYDYLNNKLVLSQGHPYALWLIDLDNFDFFRFNKKVQFSTLSNLEISRLDGGVLRRTIIKSGKQLHPILYNNKIVTLIFDAENKNMYLDIYDLNGDFFKRLKVPAIKSDLWITDFIIDGKNSIYILVHNDDYICWIERFKIDPSVFN